MHLVAGDGFGGIILDPEVNFCAGIAPAGIGKILSLFRDKFKFNR
jgi:hypothetical protein